jgi:hypothetical protein
VTPVKENETAVAALPVELLVAAEEADEALDESELATEEIDEAMLLADDCFEEETEAAEEADEEALLAALEREEATELALEATELEAEPEAEVAGQS